MEKWYEGSNAVELAKMSNPVVTAARVDVMLAGISRIKNEICSETETDWVTTTQQEIRWEIAKKIEKALLELRSTY